VKDATEALAAYLSPEHSEDHLQNTSNWAIGYSEHSRWRLSRGSAETGISDIGNGFNGGEIGGRVSSAQLT
jgi:hypothetical protein